MIIRSLKLALLGSVVGVIAHVPVALTDFSSPHLLRVVADASSTGLHGGDEQTPKLSMDEQSFVQSAYARGLFAVGAGQLAYESSSIREVRLLAAHTLAQRAVVDEKLAALAKTKGMAALHEELDANSRETLELLQQTSSDEDFELRYCRMVVASYFREIRAFEGQAGNAADPDLRKLAAEVASDLKQHLAIALVIQRALAHAIGGAPGTITASQRLPGESTTLPAKTASA